MDAKEKRKHAERVAMAKRITGEKGLTQLPTPKEWKGLFKEQGKKLDDKQAKSVYDSIRHLALRAAQGVGDMALTVVGGNKKAKPAQLEAPKTEPAAVAAPVESTRAVPEWGYTPTPRPAPAQRYSTSHGR